MNKYDIIIVGGGIGGLMSAYSLITNDPELKICMLERGNAIKRRVCPMLNGSSDVCLRCKNCAIMEGMAGAGAFSDGKYVISTEYGGWLTEFMPEQTVIDYIEKADKILVSFGATTERFMPSDELKQLCLKYDLHMAQAQVKHLGTDSNYDTMVKLIDYLSEKIEIITNATVSDIDIKLHSVTYSHCGEDHRVRGDKIIIAVGRAGSGFFSKWCQKNSIPLENNQVDIGVRVELPSIIWCLPMSRRCAGHTT